VRALPRWFLLALFAGLLLRLVILRETSTLGTGIVDEQQYRQIADSLLNGDGFAQGPGQSTSIRPPLYPGLLAATWWATGRDNLQAVRALQILLAAVTTGLVYLLGRRVFGEATGHLTAAVFWLYPEMIFANVLILTETLFTFWLAAFAYLLVVLVQSNRPSFRIAVAAGLVLGLSALTRSVLWPLPLLLCPLLLFLLAGVWTRRIATTMALFAGFAAVVGPWAVRNTRLQGVPTIVDTMGGMNLRMGNYEHTLDDRMWDTVSLKGEKNWVTGIGEAYPDRLPTEGEKDKWAQGKALAYMRAHPGVTLRRSLIKFADFWGLDREFLAGLSQGLFRPPAWFGAVAAGAILLAYPFVALAGAAGFWLTPARDWRVHLLLLLPIVAITGVHTIVFAHSRYHLPLVPIVAVFASQALRERRVAWRMASGTARVGAVVSIVVLLAIWLRQIVIVDLARIQQLLG
jgi:4-amino-4-deoxy-L-arabinose transferase-like glycosyltransferase